MATYGNENIVCPFFKDMAKNEIKCEGIFSCSTVNTWENPKNKKVHQEQYCNTFQYSGCFLAKELLLKYALEDVAEKKELYSQIYKNTQKKGGHATRTQRGFVNRTKSEQREIEQNLNKSCTKERNKK